MIMSNNNPKININQCLTLQSNPDAKKTDIQNHHLWEFPMDYPMSIIGHEGEHDTLLNEVKLILGTQFPEFDMESLVVKKSSTGRFTSVRAKLYFTDAQQVNELYASLDKAATVRTVV